MEVASDLKNVYVWSKAKKMLPMLAARMREAGLKGRKYKILSMGDAASVAIMAACKEYGLVWNETTGMPMVDRREADRREASPTLDNVTRRKE